MKLIFLKPLTVCILIVAFIFMRSSNSYEANGITLDKIETYQYKKIAIFTKPTKP